MGFKILNYKIFKVFFSFKVKFVFCSIFFVEGGKEIDSFVLFNIMVGKGIDECKLNLKIYIRFRIFKG